MASILMIGDSHLEHCHNISVKQNNSNFGYSNLKFIWESGIDQISIIQEKFKYINKKESSIAAVFVMCGGYDLMTIRDQKHVAEKLKTLVHQINSSNNVGAIIVCSLLERKCALLSQEEEVNKGVRTANKAMARAFKSMKKVFFINVRPPGKLKDIMDDDRYHLKEGGYEHILKRFAVTLEERVINEVLGSTTVVKETEEGKKEIQVTGKELTLDKRLNAFKETLLSEYGRITSEEKDLRIKLNNVQKRLDASLKEKNEVVDLYQKLFGIDLTKESVDANQ